LYAHPARRDEQALAIMVWLVLSVPVFVITWKWASGREPYNSSKTVIASPMAVDKETSSLNAPIEKQYRVCTLKVPRSLIEKGFEVPPSTPDRYILPEESPHSEIIQEMGWEAEGWNLLSMVPFEKECSEEQVTLLALMERPLSLELEEFLSRKHPYTIQ
jgi:hypothetical protein